MSSHKAFYPGLHETIEIPRSPTFPSEFTMPKFRIIIEDEKTGQEYRGWSGLNRTACDRISALINSVGAHDSKVGELPMGRNADRARKQWSADVAHVLDRKPPKVAKRPGLVLPVRKARP